MLQLCDGYPMSAINHCCAATGKDAIPGAKTVDLGIVVDDTTPNGDIFISIDYAQEIARLVGFIDPNEHNREVSRLTRLVADLDQCRAERDTARQTLASLIHSLTADPAMAQRIIADEVARAETAPVVTGEIIEPVDPW